MFKQFNQVVVQCLVFLALLGCATPYQERGFSGGVEATQLNDRLYSIYSSGNGFTSSKVVNDHALLKASEICIARGFSHFIKVDERPETSITISETRPTYRTNCSSYGNQTSCSSTPSGGSSTKIKKSKNTLEVYMLGSADEKPPNSYSCEIIFGNLSKVYIKEPR